MTQHQEVSHVQLSRNRGGERARLRQHIGKVLKQLSLAQEDEPKRRDRVGAGASKLQSGEVRRLLVIGRREVQRQTNYRRLLLCDLPALCLSQSGVLRFAVT